MSLDAAESKLTGYGSVTVRIDENGPRIYVRGFDGEGCTCRDVAVQAGLWAIGELQREVLSTIERPGGGSIGVD